jgi:hypothetical protein
LLPQDAVWKKPGIPSMANGPASGSEVSGSTRHRNGGVKSLHEPETEKA